ncbi:hypothetical protein F2Q68_00027196 [Brassica cretica]|uniref:AAA-type ATPase N-terminal domain-containing protein n=1 Tax=Brassica cretica TaxID=69181 RepID=A0A8S9I793_BRACR|nr:hypothetical protein F2Q68_00027196 [Brassica cretica]
MSSSDSSSAETRLATAKTVLTTAASVAATAVLAKSLVQDYLPDEVHQYISYGFRIIFGYFSSQMTIVIEEFEGFVHNEVYEAAEAYLATKISPSNKRIKVSKHEKENNYNVTVERDEEVVDTFNGLPQHESNLQQAQSNNRTDQPHILFDSEFLEEVHDLKQLP